MHAYNQEGNTFLFFPFLLIHSYMSCQKAKSLKVAPWKITSKPSTIPHHIVPYSNPSKRKTILFEITRHPKTLKFKQIMTFSKSQYIFSFFPRNKNKSFYCSFFSALPCRSLPFFCVSGSHTQSIKNHTFEKDYHTIFFLFLRHNWLHSLYHFVRVLSRKL